MDEEWADEFGLNYAQMRFVQDAVPGNEDAGFSEALVGVDGEWRGIQVKAMPKEKQVIDFDPTSQVRSSLPAPATMPSIPRWRSSKKSSSIEQRTERAKRAN